MASEQSRQALLSAAVLGGFAVIGASLLATAYWATKDRIAENERLAVVRQLQQILPANSYDNQLLEDTLETELPNSISGQGPDTIHLAKRDGKTWAAIVPVTAPNGYNGAIDMLLGVRSDGSVAAVRVTQHRETPGLGDGIDKSRGDWIDQFDRKSLNNPEHWAVKKDGGSFDQLTGATITPRAIVKAIHEALEYVKAHHTEIFEDGQL